MRLLRCARNDNHLLRKSCFISLPYAKIPSTCCASCWGRGWPQRAPGTGGYARYTATCPAGWKFGVAIDPAKESPLPRQPKPLRWDEQLGRRVR